jgi:hypothetical protein
MIKGCDSLLAVASRIGGAFSGETSSRKPASPSLPAGVPGWSCRTSRGRPGLPPRPPHPGSAPAPHLRTPHPAPHAQAAGAGWESPPRGMAGGGGRGGEPFVLAVQIRPACAFVPAPPTQGECFCVHRCVSSWCSRWTGYCGPEPQRTEAAGATRRLHRQRNKMKADGGGAQAMSQQQVVAQQPGDGAGDSGAGDRGPDFLRPFPAVNLRLPTHGPFFLRAFCCSPTCDTGVRFLCAACRLSVGRP